MKIRNQFLQRWLPVIVMCTIIFLFSADRNSGRHSHEVLVWLLGLFGFAKPQTSSLLEMLFRKFAHVTVYACLSALTYRAFALGSGLRFNWQACRRTVVFCALYATTDEIHQIFVPSRGPAVHDVIIDVCGAILALCVIRVVLSFFDTGDPDTGATPEPLYVSGAETSY